MMKEFRYNGELLVSLNLDFINELIEKSERLDIGGHGILVGYCADIDDFYCTDCNKSVTGETSKLKFNYCPNCGAKLMWGEVRE